MKNTADLAEVAVPESPITANLGEWIIGHPECDSICEKIGSGPDYRIYAYSLSKRGNEALQTLRDERFVGKKILMGVTMDGIRRLI
jgi:hypothetical protein